MFLKECILLVYAITVSVICDQNTFNHIINSQNVNNSTIYETSHFRHLQKREVDTTFVGNPRTREEKWYENFHIESIYQQSVTGERLVLLLNKVISKYLRACVSIVIYDQFVEQSDSAILQTFFQVSQTKII